MQKSDSIAKLAIALNKAQKEIKTAIKDSVNPYYSSSYANLASVYEACKDALLNNGFAIIQTNDVPQDLDAVIVETTLAHESGEYVTGRLQVPSKATDPQAIGSAITYGRRYGLASICCVVTEDDDGEAAMQRGVKSESETSYEIKKPSIHKPKQSDVKVDPNSEWREVTIHFGKNKGKKLGDLSPESRKWYIENWTINPKYEPKKEDLALMAAIEGIKADRGYSQEDEIPF